jgi:hypothetical protein
MEACRAGDCPIPDETEHPIITSSTNLGFKSILKIAPWIAKPAS